MQNPWHTAQPGHRIAFTDGRIFTVIAWHQQPLDHNNLECNCTPRIEPLLCVPGYIELRTVEETGEFWRHLPPGTPEPSRQDWDRLRKLLLQITPREPVPLDHLAALDGQAEFERAGEGEGGAVRGEAVLPSGGVGWSLYAPDEAVQPSEPAGGWVQHLNREADRLVRESFDGVEPDPAPEVRGEAIQPAAGVGEGKDVSGGPVSLGGQM
jgi:hypothetical protein